MANFIRSKGARYYIAKTTELDAVIAARLTSAPTGSSFATEADYLKPEVLNSLKRLYHLTAAPSPEATSTLDQVETIDEGIIQDAGDDTRATLDLGVFAVTGNDEAIETYNLCGEVRKSREKIIVLRVDPPIAPATFGVKGIICTGHVASAIQDLPTGGRKTRNVSIGVDSEEFEIDLTGLPGSIAPSSGG